MRKIYLDYAATTPTDPEAVRAMLPYFSETFGNPSSAHEFGRDARAAVEALLAGGQPAADQKASIGCSIKWRPGTQPG